MFVRLNLFITTPDTLASDVCDGKRPNISVCSAGAATERDGGVGEGGMGEGAYALWEDNTRGEIRTRKETG